MSRKEEIQTTVPMPSTPARRTDAAGKAEELLGQGRKADAPDVPRKTARSRQGSRAKITARVFPEHLQWVKDEIQRYSARNPRRPRLTIDLLMRVAIEHLRDAEDFDAVVTRHLS